MAEEKKPKQRKKVVEPDTKDTISATEAKTVGAAPGKTASPARVAEPAPPPPQRKSTKIPKLQKKNKSRLPRREKKARQKAAATQGGV
ncbi:MAG: hypothetical protein ACLQPN_02240 [Bryobacteraceae bacterium]